MGILRRHRHHHHWPFRSLLDHPSVFHLTDPLWANPERGYPEGAYQDSDFKFNPACEVTENKGEYLLKFDLPGINKDQVNIEIHDNQITVSGERKEERKEETDKNLFTEMNYGSFMRSFTLPSALDPERVEAKYDNGVLRIRIPKDSIKRATREVKIQ